MATPSYGSQYHLRRFVNDRPDPLARAIGQAYRSKLIPAPASIRWVSPLKEDGYRELGGMEFFAGTGRLDVVGKWKEFWPTSGRPPMWDGWAIADEDGNDVVLIVEAKANAPELASPPSGASPDSLTTIKRALGDAKGFIGVPESVPWHETYYQYANRLAALYFLAEVAAVPTRLLFLYFTGDEFPDGRECPVSPAAWHPHIEEAHQALGLPPIHGLSGLVMDVFVDVRGR